MTLSLLQQKLMNILDRFHPALLCSNKCFSGEWTDELCPSNKDPSWPTSLQGSSLCMLSVKSVLRFNPFLPALNWSSSFYLGCICVVVQFVPLVQFFLNWYRIY